MEFRGHDHIIEIAVFVPEVAYPAIRELSGLPVRAHHVTMRGNLLTILQASDRSNKPASYVATASRDDNQTLGLPDRADAEKSGLSCSSPHPSRLERISHYRQATITGSEL